MLKSTPKSKTGCAFYIQTGITAPYTTPVGSLNFSSYQVGVLLNHTAKILILMLTTLFWGLFFFVCLFINTILWLTHSSKRWKRSQKLTCFVFFFPSLIHKSFGTDDVSQTRTEEQWLGGQREGISGTRA